MNTSTLQASRLLMYGHDSVLLDTRSLILKMAGFDIYTVAALRTFKEAVESNTSPYKLAILCHTVPEEELESITELARRSRTALFKIDALIPPTKLITEVSRLAGRPAEL